MYLKYKYSLMKDHKTNIYESIHQVKNTVSQTSHLCFFSKTKIIMIHFPFYSCISKQHGTNLSTFDIYKNWIIQYVIFCDWLLSVNITFETFIRAITNSSFSSVLYNTVYFSKWWTYGLYTVFASLHNAATS